jgi:hypothetical protein
VEKPLFSTWFSSLVRTRVSSQGVAPLPYDWLFQLLTM